MFAELKRRRRACAASTGKRPHAAARTRRGAPAARPDQPKSTGLRGRTGPVVRPETGREARTQSRSARGAAIERRAPASFAPPERVHSPAPLGASSAGRASDRHRQAESREAGLGGDGRSPSHRARSRRPQARGAGRTGNGVASWILKKRKPTSGRAIDQGAQQSGRSPLSPASWIGGHGTSP